MLRDGMMTRYLTLGIAVVLLAPSAGCTQFGVAVGSAEGEVFGQDGGEAEGSGDGDTPVPPAETDVPGTDVALAEEVAAEAPAEPFAEAAETDAAGHQDAAEEASDVVEEASEADADSGDLADGAADTPPADAAQPPGAVPILAGGERHFLVVTKDHELWCWGFNYNGQCSSSGSGGHTVPAAPIPGSWKAVSAHSGASFAIDPGDQLYGIAGGLKKTTGMADTLSVGPGYNHVCAARLSGFVSCWGSNYHGALGIGSPDSWLVKPDPEPVPALSDVAEVRSGAHASCALLKNGEVHCWGKLSGVLQNDQLTKSSTPVKVAGIEGATALAFGYSHGCAIVGTEGRVYCWGDNSYGQLGMGQASDASLPPQQVVDLKDVAAIGLGHYHSCAVGKDGSLVCWGKNDGYQLGNGTTKDSSAPWDPVPLTDVVAVAGGWRTTCAATKNDRIYCFGLNADGQAGDGTKSGPTATPVAPEVAPTPSALSAGGGHTCVVSGGAVLCFGDNAFGQLGTSNQTVAKSAAPISVPGLPPATAVAAGVHGTCALVAGGAVYCWGALSASGEPELVLDLPEVSALGADGFALSASGEVYRWAEAGFFSGSPSQIAGLPPFAQLAGGPGHFCGVAEPSGEVWCGGPNSQGQLGTSDTGASIAQAQGVQGASWVGVGVAHSCALLGKLVWCWGANDSRQLGDPQFTAAWSAMPAEVPNLKAVSLLRVGGSYACAGKTSGELRCWGSAETQQLGLAGAGKSFVTSPVVCPELADSTLLELGGGHTCAVVAGELRCLGDNGFFQLGSDPTYKPSPVQVLGTPF
jgi:alpha-tubulin suppressor-like RCC1 family protein